MNLSDPFIMTKRGHDAAYAYLESEGKLDECYRTTDAAKDGGRSLVEFANKLRRTDEPAD